MFVVEEDGATARRCVAGDLVFLPEGWRGSFHVQARGAKAAAVRVGGAGAGAAATKGAADVTSAAVYQTAGRVASRQEVDELYDPENDNRRRRA
jgi:hypothetical protein